MRYEYRDEDATGLETLSVLSSAHKLNHWMYDCISTYCKGEILEIGSGIGNISGFFIKENRSIILSDIRSNYRTIIKNKFNVGDQSVLDINIVHPDFNAAYSNFLEKFDSIICLNVIEHIEDDESAVSNMMKLLKAGGTLVVLVPAYTSLFNGLDINLQHYRRYTKNRLSLLMEKYGRIEKTFYFNAAGVAGWWISGTILRNKNIPEREVKLFNRFIPIFRLMDKITFHKIGLSVVCVLTK